MQERGGKPVLLKSLRNIATKMQQKVENNGLTDLQQMLESMKSVPDAVINVAYEETSNELIGVYFQDARMQSVFKKIS